MSERNPVLIDRPKLRATARIRSRDERMGRFGGCWQWALGFEAGARRKNGGFTVILNLLTFSVRVEWKPTPRRRFA